MGANDWVVTTYNDFDKRISRFTIKNRTRNNTITTNQPQHKSLKWDSFDYQMSSTPNQHHPPTTNSDMAKNPCNSSTYESRKVKAHSP